MLQPMEVFSPTTSEARSTKGPPAIPSIIFSQVSNSYIISFSFRSYNTPVGQSTIQREWDSYDPIIDPTHPQLSCNLNGANLGSGQLSATVAAGSKVIAWWNQWPHNLGPVMVYMANCNGRCTSADTSSLYWFKIDEAGLLSGMLCLSSRNGRA